MGIPRGYNVYYRPLNTPFNKALRNVSVGPKDGFVVLDNLYKYVEYEIYIKAVTNKEGNASEIVKAYTDEDSKYTVYKHLLSFRKDIKGTIAQGKKF